MDYTTEIQKIRDEFLAIGFPEDKLKQLVDLAAEEAIDMALADLQQKDLPVLEELESKLKTEITTDEDAKYNIDVIFNTVYGENAENEKNKMVFEYLQTALEETKASKDLFQRYQAGDPTAVAQVNANKDNPEVDKILSQGI